jgi:hypothetical protein
MCQRQPGMAVPAWQESLRERSALVAVLIDYEAEVGSVTPAQPPKAHHLINQSINIPTFFS